MVISFTVKFTLPSYCDGNLCKVVRERTHFPKEKVTAETLLKGHWWKIRVLFN